MACPVGWLRRPSVKIPASGYALIRIQETELSRPCSPRLSSAARSKRVHLAGSSGSCDVVRQLIYDKFPVFNDALDQISN
jgi:hypothetical protein